MFETINHNSTKWFKVIGTWPGQCKVSHKYIFFVRNLWYAFMCIIILAVSFTTSCLHRCRLLSIDSVLFLVFLIKRIWRNRQINGIALVVKHHTVLTFCFSWLLVACCLRRAGTCNRKKRYNYLLLFIETIRCYVCIPSYRRDLTELFATNCIKNGGVCFFSVLRFFFIFKI